MNKTQLYGTCPKKKKSYGIKMNVIAGPQKTKQSKQTCFIYIILPWHTSKNKALQWHMSKKTRYANQTVY